jgi:hypothetical protein
LQGSHNIHNTKHITAAATAAYNIYNIDVTRFDWSKKQSFQRSGRGKERKKKTERFGEGEEIYIQFAALATS